MEQILKVCEDSVLEDMNARRETQRIKNDGVLPTVFEKVAIKSPNIYSLIY